MKKKEINLYQKEAGLVTGFPLEILCYMRAGLEEVDVGRLPGPAVGRGKKREDITVYLRALFKYMVRGGQTQKSEQTEVRTCSVCSYRAEFAGDLTGLVLLSDRKDKKKKKKTQKKKENYGCACRKLKC